MKHHVESRGDLNRNLFTDQPSRGEGAHLDSHARQKRMNIDMHLFSYSFDVSFFLEKLLDLTAAAICLRQGFDSSSHLGAELSWGQHCFGGSSDWGSAAIWGQQQFGSSRDLGALAAAISRQQRCGSSSEWGGSSDWKAAGSSGQESVGGSSDVGAAGARQPQRFGGGSDLPAAGM